MSDKDEIFEMSEEEEERVENLNDKSQKENDKMGQVKSKVKKLAKGRKKELGDDVEVEGDLDYGDEKEFICGVVEGFYGRPWTTGQRKELFRRFIVYF